MKFRAQAHDLPDDDIEPVPERIPSLRPGPKFLGDRRYGATLGPYDRTRRAITNKIGAATSETPQHATTPLADESFGFATEIHARLSSTSHSAGHQ